MLFCIYCIHKFVLAAAQIKLIIQRLCVNNAFKIYQQQIFTGGSSNKNLLRILPPLTLQKKHFDIFFKRLEKALKAINV